MQTDKTDAGFTEVEITEMVHHFYEQIRVHPNLGPIFNTHVQDWDVHLGIMVDFWSAILLRTGRFKGSPMGKHAALPDLSADLFHQWLDLFRLTCQKMPPQLGERAWMFAQRIARSLWIGYQFSQHPDEQVSELDYQPGPVPTA